MIATISYAFLQTYGETPCVSNTREVISGLPTGKLRVMHLALSRTLGKSVQLRSQRAPLDPVRPCILRTERKYCVSGRFNCDAGSKADDDDARRPYFHFRGNAFERLRERKREFRKMSRRFYRGHHGDIDSSAMIARESFRNFSDRFEIHVYI